MKLSLCSISFRYEMVSFNDLIQFAADTGFDGIELWGVHARSLLSLDGKKLDGMLEEMQGRGLAVSMISDYVDLRQQQEESSDTMDFVLDQWEARLRLAERFRTDRIRIFAGNRPSAAAGREEWSRCVRRLRAMARRAEEDGVYLVLETHPNTLMDTLGSALRLLREADHPMLKVNLDFLHLWETGTEPVAAYRSLKEWTVNYHLKNMSDRAASGVFDPVSVFAPTANRTGVVPLGEGAVDYETVLGLIARDKNPQPLAIEWFGDETRRVLRTEQDWIRAVEQQERQLLG